MMVGVPWVVCWLMRQENTSTSDWMTLGILDLKTFRTISCRISFLVLLGNFS